MKLVETIGMNTMLKMYNTCAESRIVVKFSLSYSYLVPRASSLTPPRPRDFTYRYFKALDGNVFCNYLASCDWSVFNSSFNLQTYFECFYNNLD